MSEPKTIDENEWPQVGDVVAWQADGYGGYAIVLEVNDDPGPERIPHVRVRGPSWEKPQNLYLYEIETLDAGDPMTAHIKATLEHIETVEDRMEQFRYALLRRSRAHDASKLREPEASIFAVQSAKLKYLEYGSEAYMQAIKDLGPALNHHYKHNDHHPEHHRQGVDGMDLFQLVEMFCDWCAATERMKDGSIRKSIDVNEDRFGLSPQLASILRNTAARWKARTGERLK